MLLGIKRRRTILDSTTPFAGKTLAFCQWVERGERTVAGDVESLACTRAVSTLVIILSVKKSNKGRSRREKFCSQFRLDFCAAGCLQGAKPQAVGRTVKVRYDEEYGDGGL